MRKVLSVVLAATMAMSLAACGGSGAKTDTKAADAGAAAGDEASADDYYITIKFSNVFQPAEWNYKASEYLADLVKEKTDGHIILEYYGQNQLDCYAESVAQAHNGAVWMGLEEPSYFADYIGDYNVLVGPMLYKNNAEYNAVMESDIVKDLNKNGITVIMVDHEMERVARCADQVMVLDAGEVVAVDEPKKIFGNPDIVAHHIGVPDYVKICNALREKGYTNREIEITEEPTIELVKEALKG